MSGEGTHQRSYIVCPGVKVGAIYVKKILKSIAVAFSIYSVIPMPRFEWKSEDMRYHLIFFPWVGSVIGILEWFWMWLSQKAGIGTAAYAAVGTAIPLLITGGFHLDGYLDTMDGIHSYKPKEKQLEIMSDPHVGAFAVVWGLIWILLFYAGVAEMTSGKVFRAWCLSFFLVRAFSGLGVVTLPSAKREGMLQTFAGTAQRDSVIYALSAELCICVLLMGLEGGAAGLLIAAAGAVCYIWYRIWSVRKFGGITGDLAGFFVCVSECVITLAAGFMNAAEN